jgi:hexosaminidase
MTLIARTTAAVLLALTVGVSCAAQAQVSIIPEPQTVQPAAGVFVLDAATVIQVPRGDADAARAAAYFADLMQRTRGLALAVREGERNVDGAGRNAVVFQRGDKAADAYALTVTNQGVTVTAGGFGGLLYGAVSLWQLATAEPGQGPARIDAVAIEDAPRFRWRGLMLDSARHYQSPEFIKGFIDWMAVHKLNVFHWHLTDDQAWRLEIKRYPRLTEIGAWRVPAGAAAQTDIDPATGRSRLYGGFYSQETVREIVAYAQARNIVIVPEVDVPGHASAAIVAYPELGVTDAPGAAVTAVPADWGVYPTLFNTEDSTLVFFEQVFDEVMDLFPGDYVHIGGDEAVKDQWKASARTQARMRELGVADEAALQSWFVARLEKHLNARGRRLIGWDEILEGGLAPNATVMSWRGVDGAIEAARLGHDTVMTPGPTLYFDYRQSPTDGAPGRGVVSSLEDVYRFDPTPDAMTPEQARRVLGVQANLFTEHMRTEDRVEYMAFPRVSALAEVAWTNHDRLNWDDFRRRLQPQLARYRALGIDYATSGLDAPAPTPVDGERRYDHQMKLCSEGLVLSLVDDAPLQGERPAFMMDIMNPCWIYQAADLAGRRRIEVAVGQVPFNFQIGADRDRIRLATPRSPEGELEVRVGGCDAEPALRLPLKAAASDHEVTVLAGDLPAMDGRHDVCLKFAEPGIDPMWGVDWVRIGAAR